MAGAGPQFRSEIVAECNGIRCTADHLIELDCGKVTVSVPRREIERIKLRHGIEAPNPVTQVVAGAIMVAIGYFPVVHIIRWAFQHSVVFIGLESSVFAVPVIGVYLIVSALKRGHFLEVDLQADSKRFAFRRKPSSQQLGDFIEAIEASYRLKIVREA